MEQERQMAEGQQTIRERTLMSKRIFEQRGLIIWFAIGLVLLGVLVAIGYHFEWTGFGDSVREVGKDKDLRRAKTLWDWMQLLVVPAALAIGGFWLANRAQKQRDRENEDAQNRRDAENKQRREHEQYLEQQRAQDAALQSYLDQMSHLILENALFASQQPDDVHRTLARARTLTILERLDKDRKRYVLQFLYESRLIDQEQSIIRLKEANLSEANLSQTHLPGANLPWTNLSNADLSNADLHGANLSEANLSNANLSNANLSGADLSGAHKLAADGSQQVVPNEELEEQTKSLEGATMPNVQKYEDWLKGRGEDGKNSGA